MTAEYPLKGASSYPVVSLVTLLTLGMAVAYCYGVDLSLVMPAPVIRRGEYWRLITSLFIHLDILHLGFNVYWFMTLGALAEQAYGHKRTALLLALLGIGSACTEFTFTMGGVGLSGVVDGLFGLLWVVRKDARFNGTVSISTVAIFAAWIAYCNWQAAINVFAASNVSCISGLAFGLLIGLAITWPHHRTLISAIVAVFFCASLLGATIARPLFNGFEQGQRGYEALKAKHYEEAVVWFEKSLAHLPEQGWMWSDLGIAYNHMGNKPAAAAAYQHAKELGVATK